MPISTHYNQALNQASICIEEILNFDNVMELRDAYWQQPWKDADIVVDLLGCSYIDSAALGALLLMKSQLEKADGDIVIRASETVVLQALAAAHFEKKFTIESPA